MSNRPKGLNKEKIRKLYKDGYCISYIARKYNCRQNAIYHHISDLVIPNKYYIKRFCKLSANQVKEIRKLYINSKISTIYLSSIYEVSETTILNIVHGKFYKWVPGKIINKNGKIEKIPKNYFIDQNVNKKGMMKFGPKVGSKNNMIRGGLKPIADKYNVSTSTICRWIKKEKIKIDKRKKTQI